MGGWPPPEGLREPDGGGGAALPGRVPRSSAGGGAGDPPRPAQSSRLPTTEGAGRAPVAAAETGLF